MKRKIILIILIVIVLAILGALVFSQGDRATDTQINFISSSTLKSGDNVTFELKDAQGNVLANKNVSITFVKDGETQNFTIITDSNGRGYLTLNEEPGSCQVIVSFAGDDKNNPSRATQAITIGEGSSESTTDTTYESSASYTSDSSYSSSSDSGYYSDSNVQSDTSGDSEIQAGQSSEGADSQQSDGIVSLE